MLLEMYARGKTFLWGLRDMATREDGAVATEYGLLLFLIAVAIVVAVGALGISLTNVFNQANDSLFRRPSSSERPRRPLTFSSLRGG